MTRARTITDVAERSLCTGCGTCAYVAPDAFEMVDTLRDGRRPLPLLPTGTVSPSAVEALAACPGHALGHDAPLPEGHLDGVGSMWGPVLELWEGYASDADIRFAGSSGGVATALSLHCIEQEGMSGVLHTRARADVPYLNETVLSATRAELLEAAGSRYAPSSPCDGLALVESAGSPCVFVGKPCDVAGARMAAALRPALAEKLGLTIAVFCAGTPTTAGTLEALRALRVDPDEVIAVRYRGEGWPGRFSVRTRGGDASSLSYEESWGDILQRHRQWRCRVCLDHTGEFADVSVGDPWYRPIEEGDPGRSLVLVRSERGRALLRSAVAAGALTLRRVDANVLPLSQPGLLRSRGAVWGRIMTMRAMGLPAPRFVGMPAFRQWLRLSRADQGRSTLGTARRLWSRGLTRRHPVVPWAPRVRAHGGDEPVSRREA